LRGEKYIEKWLNLSCFLKDHFIENGKLFFTIINIFLIVQYYNNMD